MLHVINHDLQKLKEEGCELADPPELFMALMVSTVGDPCTTGCAFFNEGKCKAYQKYHSIPIKAREVAKEKEHERETSGGLIGGKWAGMSSKEIREKDGNISRKEFQIRKQRGDYRE